tara:strand:- start:145 stop:759 length:615 start_codon:yes stop_codon:yes gene_type:complete
MHSTSNLEDGYLGSGKRLRYSIRKHGIENHKKEILEFLPDRKSLMKRESEIVNEELLKYEDCMNLVLGGGGFMPNDDYHKEVSSKGGKASKIAQDELRKNNPEWVEKRYENSSKAHKQVYESGRRERKQVMDWTGLKHSEETKQKMSVSSKGKGKGSSNSQYGTCWVTNGTENKKIKKEELELWESKGYSKGRKLKYEKRIYTI